jgi:hypothetical protein
MEYNKIIAVTGLPGLHELLSSKADGAIVRALDDKTTRFVSSRIHNFSHLESIEVYTIRDNVNLVDILKAMETSAEKLPDEKDNAALKNYFSKVYPDLDFDRVYSSDLKKMVKWYIVLKANDIEIKLSEPAAEEAPAEEVQEKPAAAPKKKAEKVEKAEKAEVKTKSEAAAAKVSELAEERGEEKPKAKKAATAEKAPAAGKAAAPAAVAKKKTEKTEKAPAEKPKKAAKKK